MVRKWSTVPISLSYITPIWALFLNLHRGQAKTPPAEYFSFAGRPSAHQGRHDACGGVDGDGKTDALAVLVDGRVDANHLSWGSVSPARARHSKVSREPVGNLVGKSAWKPRNNLVILVSVSRPSASLIPTVNGTRFAASLRTDNSPQRKEARPLSHALASD
jgi:hypothetical protein